MRRLVIAAMTCLLAGPALAAENSIQVNASYSFQASLTGTTDTEITAQEHKMKRTMYERATRECADLMATVALTCAVTAINVSTQVNQNLGQPPAIYVNTNVSMQVRLK